MGFYEEQVLPRLTEKACGGKGWEKYRRRAVEGLSGTLVEIGFGSGPNVELLPTEVTHVFAIEPSRVAREHSARHHGHPGLTVELVGLDGEALALPDDSCESALATFALCTIPHVERALAELRRVLLPGGRFHFLEHGRSPDPGVQRWQHRLDGVQQRIAGGCHLIRDPEQLVREAGFDIEWSQSRYVRGPKPWTWITVGHARHPG